MSNFTSFSDLTIVNNEFKLLNEGMYPAVVTGFYNVGVVYNELSKSSKQTFIFRITTIEDDTPVNLYYECRLVGGEKSKLLELFKCIFNKEVYEAIKNNEYNGSLDEVLGKGLHFVVKQRTNERGTFNYISTLVKINESDSGALEHIDLLNNNLIDLSFETDYYPILDDLLKYHDNLPNIVKSKIKDKEIPF
jgi:hypothetical protein